MGLLERAAALDDLERWLAEARAGRGHLALVGGEAGIGKTSLVDEFTRRSAKEMRLLWSACDAFSTPRALGPLVDVAPALGGRVEELLGARAPARSCSPPCSSIFGAAPAHMSWWSRTCTGPTRRRWTCCGSWPGASAACGC